METCINYTDERAFVSSDERKMINRVLKLKQQYPDEVIILQMPENNDGCIYAVVRAKWVRIQPPKKVALTDEDRRKLAERFKNSLSTGQNQVTDEEGESDGDAIL